MSNVKIEKHFLLFSITLMAVKLWLVRAHPLMVTLTPHDDLLFIREADAILRGDWLGDYNQVTLIKGPFYPLFISLCYWLNIPLLAAKQLLYGLASFVTIQAVYPFINKKWPLFLLFLFLLLNPFSFTYPLIGRCFREGIYGTLGLLTFSCFLGMFLRNRWHIRQIAAWSIGAGIFLSAFWHTREESIWLVPSLLMLFAFGFFSLRGLPRSRALRLSGFYILPLLILLGFHSILISQNKRHYGVSDVIEIETPEFESAYGGLLRIKSDQWRQFFPVVRDAREKAYAVSPAFREVQPYLEGNIGLAWQNLSGNNDIPAAFFIWAFRDAVAAAGYYKDGPSTLQYYARMGNEIDQACASGRLQCSPRITSLVPAWHAEYNHLVLPTLFSVLKQIISFAGATAEIGGARSQGSADTIQLFERVTRETALTSQPPILQSHDPKYHSHLIQEKTKILSDIGKIYRVIVPPLFLVAFIAFLGIAGRSIYRRNIRLMTLAAGAALTGIMAIASILTLLAITSYSEIARAMHASYPMVLFFIMCVVIDVFFVPPSSLSAKQGQTEESGRIPERVRLVENPGRSELQVP
jgi:hypothetical protein